MHGSSSTAGTWVRLTRSWAGCPDRVVVSGLAPDGGGVSLDIPFHRSVSRTSAPETKVADSSSIVARCLTIGGALSLDILPADSCTPLTFDLLLNSYVATHFVAI